MHKKFSRAIAASLMAATMIAPTVANVAPMSVSAGQVLGESTFDFKALPWHTCETSPAKQDFLIEDGAFHITIDKADGGAYIAALSAKICLDQEKAYYTSPAFNGSSMARDEVGALMQRCLTEETSDVDALLNEAFADAIDECEYNS